MFGFFALVLFCFLFDLYHLILMLPFFFSWVSSFTDQNFETVRVNAKIIRLKFVTNIYC